MENFLEKIIEKSFEQISHMPSSIHSNTLGPNPKDNDELFQDIFNTPLFMTQLPDDPTSNDALSAIQSLVFDGPPEEVALNFKNHGNEAFGEKNYRSALEYYSKAIDQQTLDPLFNSILYTNRASTHYQLQNYRKCLQDCSEALKLNPLNIKAYFRSSKALEAVEKLDEALQILEVGLSKDSSNAVLVKELESIQEIQKKKKLKLQQQEQVQLKLKLQQEALQSAIQKRGIRCINTKDSLYGSLPQEHKVSLENGKLKWPVLFLYPEYQESDLISSFHEENTFNDHLQIVFESYPPWDIQKEYEPDRLQVFFECKKGDQVKLMRVGRDMTLKSVLSSSHFTIVDGIATFFILVEDSSFTESFKSHYTCSS